MDKIDLHAVTYTDDNGDEKNAYDYLMANYTLVDQRAGLKVYLPRG